MKLRIEKPFVDKITEEKYEPGDVKEFEDDRAKEILDDPRHLASKFQEKRKAKK